LAGLIGRMMSRVARSRFLYRATKTQKRRGQTYILRVGFETTIPMFVWAKTFHALAVHSL
jgi:hypothetical protein